MSECLVIHNIGMLATPEGRFARRGKSQAEIRMFKNACIIIQNGKIVKIATDTFTGNDREYSGYPKLDAMGCLVTPGLVDCHTHLVFGGWRQGELKLKLAGKPYLEILAAGGGILSTVDATRKASPDELFSKAGAILDECLSYGVTTLEAKSGYGLNLENELKCLETVKRLKTEHPVGLMSTFMGAHAVPGEFAGKQAGYVNLVCGEMLYAAAQNGLAEFCDVFCEKGAFSLVESEKILNRAKGLGMKLKIHAEEISTLGGAVLAAKLGCISADHLIKIDGAGIQALAESETIAVCLPCTSFYLNEGYAPARGMIAAGIPVAVATDFNPGSSPNLNLQFAMNLACYQYRMTPEEALTAVTLNAAAAVGRSGEIGSVEAGKAADLVIWNAKDLDYIFYRYGSNLVKIVIKSGKIYGQQA